MQTAHIYITIDNESPAESEKNYGYVLEFTSDKGTRTREGFGKITGTYHKATLTAMIEAIKRFNRSCEIHIHSKNMFVLGMFEKNLPIWVANEFHTQKNKPVANEWEWRELWGLSNKHLILTEAGNHSYSEWLLSEIKRREPRER